METKRRKVVQSDAREIIARVYHFLKNEFEFTVQHNSERCDFSHLRNIRQRTADATGSSVRTVSRILREEKELPTPNSKFPSPVKNRNKRANKVEIDKHTADVVRSTIQDFLATHNEMPTLKTLKLILHEKIGYSGCLSTLQKMLLKLGYEWNSKDGNGRKVLSKKAPISNKSDAVRNGPPAVASPSADPSWAAPAPRGRPTPARAPVPAPAPAPDPDPAPAPGGATPARAPVEIVYEYCLDIVKEEPIFQ